MTFFPISGGKMSPFPLLNSLLLADRILPSADYVEKCSSSDIKSKLNQRNDFSFLFNLKSRFIIIFLNVSFVAAEQYKYFFYGNHELESLPITNGSLFLFSWMDTFHGITESSQGLVIANNKTAIAISEISPLKNSYFISRIGVPMISTFQWLRG